MSLQKFLLHCGYTLGDSCTAIKQATTKEKEAMEKLLANYLISNGAEKQTYYEKITTIADEIIVRYGMELITNYCEELEAFYNQ